MKQDQGEIRKAILPDVVAIHELIKAGAIKGAMLPRSVNYIGEHIRDYFIFELAGKVCGVCALRLSAGDPCEIVSLVVGKGRKRRGLGRRLVEACLEEARQVGAKQVFALTKVPDFFYRLGFKDKKREQLPRKIWTECVNCPKFPDCDEQAVAIVLKRK